MTIIDSHDGWLVFVNTLPESSRLAGWAVSQVTNSPTSCFLPRLRATPYLPCFAFQSYLLAPCTTVFGRVLNQLLRLYPRLISEVTACYLRTGPRLHPS
jgi:hypothetical protein